MAVAEQLKMRPDFVPDLCCDATTRACVQLGRFGR
jgi:hypothetical protein